MRQRKNKIFHIILILFLILPYITKAQDATCEINSDKCGSDTVPNTEHSGSSLDNHDKLDLKYEDLFLRQGQEREEYKNSFINNATHTDYFDVKLFKEEIEYLKKEKLVYFPPKKFHKYNQGNFLHFYRTAYLNKFPVYFTVDSMLYPLNENKRIILYLLLDDIIHPILVNFFKNITTYICNLRAENKDNHKVDDLKLMHAQIYFGSGHEFLIDKLHNTEYDHGSDVNQYIKGLTVLAKYYSLNEFAVMMNKKIIDTSSLRPNGFWTETRERANIYIMLRWYIIARFDLKEDLFSLYLLGKLIHDSGLGEMYNEIRDILGYFIGEDKNSPNMLEIYEIAQSLGYGDTYDLTEEERGIFYKRIKENTFSPDIAILNDHILYSREHLYRFKQEREDSSVLFNYKYSLESWVFNKITDYRSDKLRLLVSSIELIDAMHHASNYREIIFNRYKGKKSHPDEQLFRFRDKVDVKENFEKAKYSIKRSMQNNTEKWRTNLENHLHLLTYKSTRKIKNVDDTLYKSDKYKEKIFYTAYGSFIHSKHELNLIEVDIGYKTKTTEGEIVEVYMEPNLEFYKELNILWGIFKEKTSKSFSLAERYIEKEKFEKLKNKANKIFVDYQAGVDLCIKAIELQLNESTTEHDREFKRNLNNLIFYNSDTKKWAGWYTNLYNSFNENKIFSYNIWVHNLFTARENTNHKFPGAFIFNAMNFPYIGYIVVHDKVENTHKLLLYSSYDAREFIKEKSEKISFEDVSEEIIQRD